MNFPYIGDAEAFLAMGVGCARNLTTDPFTWCYNGVRPVGAIAYFALPHLLTDDPIIARYVLAGLNVLVLMLLCNVLVRLTGAISDMPRHLRWPDYLVVGLVWAMCLPFIPVALSDLPAVTAYCAGLFYLFRSTSDRKAAFLAGLFLGISCLIKQNYYVFSVMAFVIFCAVNTSRIDRATLFRFAIFGAGASVALIQIVWVYLHTGHIYPYDPILNKGFDEIRKPPVIEMAAYTWPISAGYLSSIDTTAISALSHLCIKILQGFFTYRPAVYLGAPPSGSPLVMHVNAAFLIKAYAATSLLVGGLLASAYVSNKRDRTIVLLVLGSTIFTAWYIHVENRYFLLPKLLLATWFAAVLLPAAWRRLSASAGEAIFAGSGPGAPPLDTPGGKLGSSLWRIAFIVTSTICFLSFQHEGLVSALRELAALLRPGSPPLARVPYGALFLAKCALAAGYVATVFIINKTGLLMASAGMPGLPGRRAAAVFATMPLVIFPVIFMGHVETLGALFVSCSVYFYFRRKYFRSLLTLVAATAVIHLSALLLLPFLLVALRTWHSEANRQKAIVLLCCGVLAAAFALTGWHPQRLILIMPFLAFATLYLRRPAVFYAIEVLAAAAFVWLCAAYVGAPLDSDMLQAGVFKNLFPVVYLHNADIWPSHGIWLTRTLFYAYLFSPLAILAYETASATYKARVDADNWLRGRWVAGMALLVFPTVYCAFASEWQSPHARAQEAISRLQIGLEFSKPDRSIGEVGPGVVIRQELVADKNGLVGVAVRFATYARENKGAVEMTLTDAIGRVLASDRVDAKKLRDNQFYGFRFAPIADSAGRKIILSVRTEGSAPGRAVTIWTTDNAPADGNTKLTVDGSQHTGVLNFRLLYLP